LTDYVLRFDQVSINDVELVGGKNASLGEMIGNLASAGVEVPNGFATTADAYREFLSFDGLDQRIAEALDGLDVNDISALTTTGKNIRTWIHEAPLPPQLEAAVRESFAALQAGNETMAVAVR
jgi:pyruvate,water dikinase